MEIDLKNPGLCRICFSLYLVFQKVSVITYNFQVLTHKRIKNFFHQIASRKPDAEATRSFFTPYTLRFYKHTPSLYTVREATLGTLSLSAKPLFNLWDAIPCHGHQALPKPFQREAGDFLMDGKYPKHVPTLPI